MSKIKGLQNKKSLRIAMLGHKRIPSREGGVEVVVEELAARMANDGHEVVCYNRRGHHVSGKEFDSKGTVETYKGIKIKSVCTIDIMGLAAMTSSFFAALSIAFGRYDIVHFHAEGPCVMLWIPKLFGKRCIATVHGLDWQRDKWKDGFGSKYIKFGEKMLVKYADEIIVLSDGVKKYFYDTYHREVTFISNGISRPIKREANLIKSEFGIDKNDYFCYLGRLTNEKGVHYLIDAYKQIETDKKLVIAGASSDTDDYVKMLHELTGEDERIIFTGFVQGEILDEIYSNAYTYVLPSNLEGMPLSLLEAMSYGNCVIGSDINEIAEVVKEKAILFQKGNVKDLAEKLQMVSDHPELVNEYKAMASDYICDKYCWDDVTAQTLQLYTKHLLEGMYDSSITSSE
jgi:glycosyltransferase involved in cell wall biosynthesis